MVVELVTETRGITVLLEDVTRYPNRNTHTHTCVTLKCHARMSRWVTPLSRWVTAGRHAKMSRFCVTLTESRVWGGEMGGRMVFSGFPNTLSSISTFFLLEDVARDSNLNTPLCHGPVTLGHAPVSRANVTLRCHAKMSRYHGSTVWWSNWQLNLGDNRFSTR